MFLKDGCTLSGVSATEGTYKNIKDLGDNTYRITKVNADTTVTITTEQSETPSGILLGDADGDGEVTILDATWIQRTLVDIGSSADFNEVAADVDGDGDMTILDATYIQRYLVGVPVPYAIGETVSS